MLKITKLTLLTLAATGTACAAMLEYDSNIDWRAEFQVAQKEAKENAIINEFLTQNKFKTLEQDADAIHARNTYGATPSHIAATKGNATVLNIFIARRADVNARDNFGMMPLHFAAEACAKIVTMLIACGADINARTNYNCTPLHESAFLGNTAAATVLIARGADVNARDNDGNTPFDIAIQEGHPACAELLRAAQEAKNKGQRP